MSYKDTVPPNETSSFIVTSWLRAALDGTSPQDKQTYIGLAKHLAQLGIRDFVYVGSSIDITPVLLSNTGGEIHLIDLGFLSGSRFFKHDGKKRIEDALNVVGITPSVKIVVKGNETHYEDNKKASPRLILHGDTRNSYFPEIASSAAIFTNEVSPPPAPEFFSQMKIGGIVVYSDKPGPHQVLDHPVYLDPRLTYRDLGFEQVQQYQINLGLPLLRNLRDGNELINRGISSYNENRRFTILRKKHEPAAEIREKLAVANSISEIDFSIESVLGTLLGPTAGERAVALRLLIAAIDSFLHRVETLPAEKRAFHYRQLRNLFTEENKNGFRTRIIMSNPAQNITFEELWITCWTIYLDRVKKKVPISEQILN